MIERHEDRWHLLVVSPDGDDGEVYHEFRHWPDCPTETQTIFDHIPPYEAHTCMTAAMWDEAGRDWLDKPLEPGVYAAKAWSTPGGWAGANPIDPDGGFDIIGPLPEGD